MAKKVQPKKVQAKKVAVKTKTAPVKKTAPAKKTAPVKSVSRTIPVKVVKPVPAAKGVSALQEETKKTGGTLSVKTESQRPAATGKEIKAILLKSRKNLLKEIIEYRVRESDPLKKDVGDIYDDASSERDRELSLLLGDRDRQKLIEIDDALHRIDSGEYGVCESCGERIAPGRIKAQPFTRLCINCKAEEERQEARQKKFEAEGVFRNINYSEEEEG